MTLWQQGAGLTVQRGPFKVKPTDRPVSFQGRGGGVGTGGTAHAGHGDWNITMTPKVLRALPYPLAPSQYALLVGPAQPSTKYKKQSIRFNGIQGPVVGQVTQQNNTAGQTLGPATNVQPAAGLDDGGEDDMDLEQEYEDALDQADRDSAVGDTSVRRVPGQYPNQQQYNTAQPIVIPLLGADRPQAYGGPNPDLTPEQEREFQIGQRLNALPTSKELELGHQLREANEAIDRALMVAGAPTTQGAHVRDQAVGIIENLNGQIAAATDTINLLRTDNHLTISQATTRITELEAKISELNSLLETQPVRANNAATSSSLVQQAMDISTPEYTVSSNSVRAINTAGLRPRFGMNLLIPPSKEARPPLAEPNRSKNESGKKRKRPAPGRTDFRERVLQGQGSIRKAYRSRKGAVNFYGDSI